MLKRYSLLLREEQFKWLQEQAKPGNAMSHVIRKLIDEKMEESKQQ